MRQGQLHCKQVFFAVSGASGAGQQARLRRVWARGGGGGKGWARLPSSESTPGARPGTGSPSARWLPLPHSVCSAPEAALARSCGRRCREDTPRPPSHACARRGLSAAVAPPERQGALWGAVASPPGGGSAAAAGSGAEGSRPGPGRRWVAASGWARRAGRAAAVLLDGDGRGPPRCRPAPCGRGRRAGRRPRVPAQPAASRALLLPVSAPAGPVPGQGPLAPWPRGKKSPGAGSGLPSRLSQPGAPRARQALPAAGGVPAVGRGSGSPAAPAGSRGGGWLRGTLADCPCAPALSWLRGDLRSRAVSRGSWTPKLWACI